MLSMAELEALKRVPTIKELVAELRSSQNLLRVLRKCKLSEIERHELEYRIGCIQELLGRMPPGYRQLTKP